jgi:hypothetical protein
LCVVGRTEPQASEACGQIAGGILVAFDDRCAADRQLVGREIGVDPGHHLFGLPEHRSAALVVVFPRYRQQRSGHFVLRRPAERRGTVWHKCSLPPAATPLVATAGVVIIRIVAFRAGVACNGGLSKSCRLKPQPVAVDGFARTDHAAATATKGAADDGAEPWHPDQRPQRHASHTT